MQVRCTRGRFEYGAMHAVQPAARPDTQRPHCHTAKTPGQVQEEHSIRLLSHNAAPCVAGRLAGGLRVVGSCARSLSVDGPRAGNRTASSTIRQTAQHGPTTCGTQKAATPGGAAGMGAGRGAHSKAFSLHPDIGQGGTEQGGARQADGHSTQRGSRQRAAAALTALRSLPPPPPPPPRQRWTVDSACNPPLALPPSFQPLPPAALPPRPCGTTPPPPSLRRAPRV
eukprot:365414-Chlamydomonas_euryale.AAC.5